MAGEGQINKRDFVVNHKIAKPKPNGSTQIKLLVAMVVVILLAASVYLVTVLANRTDPKPNNEQTAKPNNEQPAESNNEPTTEPDSKQTAWRGPVQKAKEASITVEIAQLQMALDMYRTQYGDFPPDGSGDADQVQASVLRHIYRTYPRYRPGVPSGTTTGTNWDKLKADIKAGYPGFELEALDPASAFVFFLGGMPDKNGKPTGFSANPTNPFAVAGSRIEPFFEFDESRYRIVKGVPVYYPLYPEGNKIPYVYFRAGMGGYDSARPVTFESGGTCGPYKKGGDWCQPKGFQIITTGLDGEFGGSQEVNSLNPKDDDNQTSFAPGRLKDAADAE